MLNPFCKKLYERYRVTFKMSDFSQLLSNHIHEKNIKTYALAQYCGLDRSNMYKLIKKKRKPSSLEMVQKMVDQEKKDAFMASVFHFYRKEDDILTFMYGMDGQMMEVNVGMNVYQDCTGILERNPQMKPAEGFETVDATWLSSKLA